MAARCFDKNPPGRSCRKINRKLIFWSPMLLAGLFAVQIELVKFVKQFQHMQKTVEQKVKESRQLIIQGMEKTLQHKMVYMYLKDRKKEADVKVFSVNGKDGIIKMEFVDHEKARAFYDEANFVEKILIRPFNIYFNLTLSDTEMKKFYLEGITEENQRKLFEESRKLGFCKLYTSYSSGHRGKLKPNGVLSFIRKEEISEGDFKLLSENLKALGIKVQKYIHDKGLKCSINLLNFYEGDLQEEDFVIQQAAESRARQLIHEMTKEVEINLSVIVKKKDAVNDKIPAKTTVTALIEYSDVQKTMDVFEQMRDYLIDRGQTKAVLYFHNEQNNSYLSLFTPGLAKPEALTEKQFQKKLLQDFRKVNPNVVQVNTFAVQYNNTYIGRVYLKTEQDGKDFIVDYQSKRGQICKNYREQNAPIVFNINIDIKTLRKIKQAERKARETEDKIKKQSEANRRDVNRLPPNKMALPNNIQGLMPGIQMNPMFTMLASNNNNNPMMQPMNNMNGIPMNFPNPNKINPPNMGPGPIPGIMPQQLDIKTKIKQIIRDRVSFDTMEVQHAKRFLLDPIKFSLEESGTPHSELGSVANILLKDTDVPTLIHYLESPTDLKARLATTKH